MRNCSIHCKAKLVFGPEMATRLFFGGKKGATLAILFEAPNAPMFKLWDC